MFCTSKMFETQFTKQQASASSISLFTTKRNKHMDNCNATVAIDKCGKFENTGQYTYASNLPTINTAVLRS